MREIKFRGKMIPENEWIYGTLLRIPHPPACMGKEESDEYYIQFADPRYMPDWNMPYRMVQGEVEAETIGQYTGLKDKIGKEIYEGDIVKRHEHSIKSENCHVMSSIGQIKFLDGAFGFYKEKGNMYLFNSLHDELEYEELNYYEVIGNIYENSDLLKD